MDGCRSAGSRLEYFGKFSPSIKRWTKSEHQKAKRFVSCSQLLWLSINFSAAAAPQNKCLIKSQVCSKVTLKRANCFNLNMRVCQLNCWMEKQMYWLRRGKFRALDSQLSIFSQTCVYTLIYMDQACHLEKGFLWIWRQENTRVHGFTVRWYIWSGREGKVEDKVYKWSVEAKTLMEKSCFCHKLMWLTFVSLQLH